MGPKRKQPVSANPKKEKAARGEAPRGPKAPRGEAPADSTATMRVAWRFNRMDWGGPFSCCHLMSDCGRDVFGALGQIETQTWAELSRKHHHAIDCGQLSKEARVRLAEIRLDDLDEVFSFRVSAKERVIGIRRLDGVCELLWWDPEHQVCPSKKKHT